MNTHKSGHSVTWTLSAFGVSIKFHCHEPEGSRCREYCQGSCEDGSTECDDCENYGHTPPIEVRHCTYCGTPIVPTPCIIAEWMNDEGEGIDCYEGPDTSVRDGGIVVKWNYGYYTWKYQEQEEKLP